MGFTDTITREGSELDWWGVQMLPAIQTDQHTTHHHVPKSPESQQKKVILT